MNNKSFSQTITVTENQTAEHLGSTPAMIALMENTAMKAITDLPEGSSSVGIFIQTSHLKASKVGETIHCTATIIAQEGRKYSFKIIAKNSNEDTIGEGTHERVLVDIEKFMSKIN